MAKITFITKDNEAITAEGTSGSVMELAKAHKVEGIDGDCGGVCSCGTCHVHVSPHDINKTGTMTEIEKYTLEFEDDVTEFSRLSCQLRVNATLDDIILKVVN